MATVLSPSPALLAAQARLLALRAQVCSQSQTPSGTISACPAIPASAPTIAEQVAMLPPHLGWGSQPLTAVIRQTPSTTLESTQSLLQSLQVTPIPPPPKPLFPDHVRHHPSLGIAARRTKQVAPYRLWLACRALDCDGRGWLTIEQIRQIFTNQESPYRLYSWKRLKQILNQGHNTFWVWDRTNKRLWLTSVLNLTANLGLSHLSGHPVKLPIAVVTGRLAVFNAELYAAWHSGRRTNGPISRYTQEEVLGIPLRTQRHYTQVANLKTTPNYNVGQCQTPENLETHAWKQGRAAFTFIDHHGRLGPKDRRYNAHRLPNSYQPKHQCLPQTSKRRINRQLKADLANNGMKPSVEGKSQGNDFKPVRRIFFEDGKAAVLAWRKNKEHIYWREKRARRYALWGEIHID